MRKAIILISNSGLIWKQGEFNLGFRDFIDTLSKNGELTHITKPVSTEYEIASIIEALGEKPVYFDNVKEASFPVVGGLISSKDLIARAIGSTKERLLPVL